MSYATHTFGKVYANYHDELVFLYDYKIPCMLVESDRNAAIKMLEEIWFKDAPKKRPFNPWELEQINEVFDEYLKGN